MKAILKYGLIVTLVWSLGFPVLSAAAAGAVPGRINYQGKLSDPEGLLIEQECEITFAAFTGAAGGDSVWSETHDRVQVTRGLFNVILGSVVPLTDVFQGYDALYLEITVNGETLSPRQEMAAAGYAMRTSGINVGPDGNVGIGTVEPAKKLSVVGRVISKSGGKTFYLIPRGGIIMWFKPLAQIPSGWQICDGTGGTPDLRDRFIYGVGTGENPGATGGASGHTHSFSATVSSETSSTGAHSHTASGVPGHTHTIAATAGSSNSTGAHTHSFNPPNTSTGAASHAHSIPARASTGGSNLGRGSGRGSTTGTTSQSVHNASDSHSHSATIGSVGSGGGGTHSHSLSFSAFASGSTGVAAPTTSDPGAHSHTLADYTASGTTGSGSNLPPYLKLAFIMRME